MKVIRASLGMVAALALLTPALAPASSTTYRPLKRAPQKPAAALAPGFAAFTPAAADPRLAAAFARSGLGGPAATAFRFTPAGAKPGRRAVTVALRSQLLTRGDALSRASALAATPGYNLGLAVGWQRFALSGDLARVDTGLAPGGRESADVGFSFSGNRWSTKLDLAAERSIGEHSLLLGPDRSYSLGLGGAYAVTRSIAVTGGVRYRLDREQILPSSDTRRDSQAVYLGTAFRF